MAHPALEEINKTLNCNVCDQLGIAGVAASPFGPVSFAYCSDCLAAGAEVWGVITYAVHCGGGPEKCTDFAKQTLEATMKRLGKTQADLDERLKLLGDEEAEERLQESVRYLKESGYSFDQIAAAFKALP